MFEILRPGKLPGDLLDIGEKNRVDFESLGPKMSILVFRAPDSPSNTKGVSQSLELLKELPPLLHVCVAIFRGAWCMSTLASSLLSALYTAKTTAHITVGVILEKKRDTQLFIRPSSTLL